jgi:hypothetical protein
MDFFTAGLFSFVQTTNGGNCLRSDAAAQPQTLDLLGNDESTSKPELPKLLLRTANVLKRRHFTFANHASVVTQM